MGQASRHREAPFLAFGDARGVGGSGDRFDPACLQVRQSAVFVDRSCPRGGRNGRSLRSGEPRGWSDRSFSRFEMPSGCPNREITSSGPAFGVARTPFFSFWDARGVTSTEGSSRFGLPPGSRGRCGLLPVRELLFEEAEASPLAELREGTVAAEESEGLGRQPVLRRLNPLQAKLVPGRLCGAHRRAWAPPRVA